MNIEAGLRQQLKTETAEAHLDVEKKMGVMDDDLTVSRYKEILKSFYAFYLPFEARIGLLSARSAAAADYIKLRRKSDRLVRDLRHLGMSDAEIRRIPLMDSDLFEFLETDQIWGALYVIEGSTLGGQLITRRLRERFEIQDDSGLEFFAGYQSQTGEMWRVFCRKLEEIERSDVDRSDVIAGANRTFKLMTDIL